MEKLKAAIVTITICFGLCVRPVKAADAYWLDQNTAVLYIVQFKLDDELKEMSKEGASTLLLHADSLPSMISSFIAWRAKEVADMKSIAWIQRPNKNNLRHASKLSGFNGVQIDDHYFNNPPVSLNELRVILEGKELWCSFQPRQFSNTIANN